MKRLFGLLTVTAAVLCLVASAYADTVTFENGDRLSGRIVGEEDGKVVLEVPGIGEVRIEKDRIVESDVETATLEEDLETTVAVLAEEVEKEEKSPWTWRLDLGATYSTGNTERVGLAFKAEAKRSTKDSEILAWASVVYTEDDKNRTENEQIIAGRYDWKFENWYLFAGANFERDEFEDLDLRAQFLAGAGTWLAKSEKNTMKVETAPAATYIDYRRDWLGEEWRLEWIFAFSGEWIISENLTITQWIRWIPNLSNTPEWRSNWLTEFITPLAENVSGKLSIWWDYNTDPAPGIERSDFKILLSLVFTF